MPLVLKAEYPNGNHHRVVVEKPHTSNHCFWGPQITRASNVTLEGDGPWEITKIHEGVCVRYTGDDPDHWQIGHSFTDLQTWKYDWDKYKAFWDGVWPGILE